MGKLLAGFGLGLLWLGSCAGFGGGGIYKPSATSEEERLWRRLAELRASELDRDPEQATCLSQRRGAGHWTDRSESRVRQQNARNERELELLRSEFDKGELGLEARLALRAQEIALERQIASADFLLERAVLPAELDVFADVARFLIESQPLTSVEDAGTWLALLRDLPKQFRSRAELLQKAATAGNFPARSAIDAVLAESAEVWTARLLAHFERALLQVPQIEHSRRQSLLAAARSTLSDLVLPARAELEAVLKTLEPQAFDDGGLWRLPRGERLYKFMLHSSTGSAQSPADLHRWALAEVQRHSEEIRDTLERAGRTENLEAYLALRRAQPSASAGLPEHTQEQVLLRVQDLLDALPATLDNFLSEAQAPLVRVRWREEEEFVGHGERVLWPKWEGDHSSPLWVLDPQLQECYLEPTCQSWIREQAYPGKLFAEWVQRSSAATGETQGLSAHLPTIHAWAAYAAALNPDPNPEVLEQELPASLANLTRTAILVADLGLHAKRWTPQRALEYIFAHSADSAELCAQHLLKILREPGASAASVLGAQKLVEWRARAKRRLASRLDVRRFHRVLLESMHLPMPLLEQRVEAWIASELP